jgi:opacity protein-like surface antigen
MQYKRILLSILFIFGISLTTKAQRAEVGIVAGGAGYIGDLNQYNLTKISGITAGAFAKVNFTPFIGLGLHYNYGKIKANDLNSTNQQFKDRGLNFNTSLNEVSLIADVNFLDAFSPISKRRFTPYVFAGIGGVLYTPRANYTNFNNEILSDYQTNADINGTSIPYKPYAITIPYGAGVKYRLTNYLTLSSQIGYRTALTDYLDDVGGYYTGEGTPDDPSIIGGAGRIGTQRGDLRKRDTYMFVSIGISYTFVSQKCFTF